MRTPGRCSNIEGCWISASHRDVWLNVGEDFTCPNCGGALSAPPGRALSMRGIKRAAVTGVAASMAVAAVAVIAVKVSAMAWSGQPAVVAMMHVRSALFASTVHHQAAPAQIAAVAPAPAIARPSIAPAPRMAESVPSRPSGPAPVLLYAAAPPPAAAPRQAAPDAAPVQTASAPADRDVPPAMVTLLSEAEFVLKPSEQRAIVLPISFGQPPAPETDAAPADHRWHHHGLSTMRRSYFLPAPGGDTVSAICRSPSMLH
jgi:hypothetical protein